jgi:hypothetical protein
MIGACVAILLGVGAIAVAQEIGTTQSVGQPATERLERFRPEAQNNPSISGSFEPYGVYNKMKVTATLIANPKKMDDVTIGYVYDAKDIVRNVTARQEFSELSESGGAAMALAREGGFLVISGGEAERLCGSLTMSADECLKALVNRDSQNLKVITISHKVGNTSPEGPVIGWESAQSSGSKR